MRETTKQEGAANFDDLQQYAQGLVCLTGGDEGPLAAALMRGGEEAGRETVEQLIRIFGPGNVYVELQRHREREEEWRNQAAIRIARAKRLYGLSEATLVVAASLLPQVLFVLGFSGGMEFGIENAHPGILADAYERFVLWLHSYVSPFLDAPRWL